MNAPVGGQDSLTFFACLFLFATSFLGIRVSLVGSPGSANKNYKLMGVKAFILYHLKACIYVLAFAYLFNSEELDGTSFSVLGVRSRKLSIVWKSRSLGRCLNIYCIELLRNMELYGPAVSAFRV
jgi:hypothetical protein